MNIRTAVIPVAGKGTRFQPVTRVVAKELLPLVDTPILHHIVSEAALSGIKRIILVTSKGKSSVEDYFDHDFSETHLQGIEVLAVRQRNPRGLGHAVLCAKPLLEKNEAFAVLLGDDVIDAEEPCIGQLVKASTQHGDCAVVGVMEVPQEHTSRYGIVSGKPIDDKTVLLDTLVEKPDPAKAPSRLAIPGRYLLTHEIFSILENQKPGVGGEIQLTDALQELCKKQKMLAYKFKGRRFDAGDRFGYLEANIHFALKRPEMREKVQQLIRGLSS